MAKEIIINADMAEEVRIAIVEGGKLADLDIEAQSRTKHKGNIYKGIISNIEDSLDAAFVEFGEEKHAFLPLSEVRPELIPAELKGQKRLKMSQVFVRGQEVVVQITKDEIGNKGAAVSTYLSLPGRYVVLMHSDESGGGISRKIDSEQARQAARDMLERLSVPEGMAVIIRTAGMTASRQDLFRDFRSLCEAWNQIDKGAQLGRAPTMLYREPEIIVRTIRDYFGTDVSKVVIDDEDEFEEAQRYFSTHMPDLVKILERHKRKEPIFQYYGIEQAIEELFQREVKLPSGGYIVIEQTEALVSIDVNSGRSTKEEGHAATVYKTNLEAAEEIARQLRLRDMGGIVVVDFIDMLAPHHNREVERRIKDLMRHDKARVKVSRISENGTLELTRQRLRQSHSLVSQVQCTHCSGTGRVRDAQGLAVSALRKIGGHLSKRKGTLASLTARVPVEVANKLNNDHRKDLMDLEEAHEVRLKVYGDVHLIESECKFDEERRGQAGLEAVQHNREAWNDGNKRRKGAPKKEGWQEPRPNLPPPSIGPVPTFIEVDESAEEWANSEPEHAPQLDAHFDDPMMQALFGEAPDVDLSGILQDGKVEQRGADDDQEDDRGGRGRGRHRRGGRGGQSRGPNPDAKVSAQPDVGNEIPADPEGGPDSQADFAEAITQGNEGDSTDPALRPRRRRRSRGGRNRRPNQDPNSNSTNPAPAMEDIP